MQPSAVCSSPVMPERALRPRGCDCRVIESPSAGELYITATPDAGSADAMYAQIAGVLREYRAAIVEERLFASADAIPATLHARGNAYGDLDDGVLPTLLTPRMHATGIVGVQVHAVRGIAAPAVLRIDQTPVARAFACDGVRYLTASGLGHPELSGGPEQTRCIFEDIDKLVNEAGGSLFDLARTWIWMDDVLAWYPQLNQARNAFFKQHNLMRPPGHMPASTGIGVSPAAGRVAIDVFAAWGRGDAIARHHAAGNQRSAYEYGSAFARAASVRTAAGRTVFCSGTAAINSSGNTCYLDDIAGQVRMTIDNVAAVLHDTDCGEGDVVQAMAYCATPEVERHFVSTYADRLPWPCLTMVGDVCRANLLFEVEVTACAR